jgi:hypothetical protein
MSSLRSLIASVVDNDEGGGGTGGSLCVPVDDAAELVVLGEGGVRDVLVLRRCIACLFSYDVVSPISDRVGGRQRRGRLWPLVVAPTDAIRDRRDDIVAK